MHIIAFGDIHSEYSNVIKIPQIEKADLVIVTGDLTNRGGRTKAKKVIDFIFSVNQNILALVGNMDKIDVGDFLDEIGVNLHGRGKVVDRLGIFGVGGSNPTPFNTPTEYTEAELDIIVNRAFHDVQSATAFIFVSHAPPFNTMTDQIAPGTHVGSTAIQQFITKVQPHICLTGHIHEGKAIDFIGKTKILNPGMLKDGGYVEIFLNNDEIEAEIKHCG